VQFGHSEKQTEAAELVARFGQRLGRQRPRIRRSGFTSLQVGRMFEALRPGPASFAICATANIVFSV
jgi:hypothetical protein